MLLLTEAEIRQVTSPASALAAVREAFRALHEGAVTVPEVMTLELPADEGDVHVKGAHLHAAGQWTLKVASAFARNPAQGLPMHSGLSMVFDARTGVPAALLLDNGFLTELRTGAAGALAADLLARPEAGTVAVIGAGSQARYQLEALRGVRSVVDVRVVSRAPERAARLAAELGGDGLAVRAVDSVPAALAGADIVVTTTPAHQPVLRGEWLEPGMHVTAVGADMPGKRELDAAALRRADLLAVDLLDQARTQGELHHGLRDGVVAEADVVTLGAVLAGATPGRGSASDITIADLTGVGAQDAAIAAQALRDARAAGLGRELAAAS